MESGDILEVIKLINSPSVPGVTPRLFTYLISCSQVYLFRFKTQIYIENMCYISNGTIFAAVLPGVVQDKLCLNVNVRNT